MAVFNTPITTDDQSLGKVLKTKQPVVLYLHDGDKNKPLEDALNRVAKKNTGELLVVQSRCRAKSENPL